MAANTQSRKRIYSARAGEFLNRARQETTTSRLVTAGALAAGAAAFALFRDPARRDRMREATRNYIDRGSAWWQGSSPSRTSSAADIPVS